MRSPIIAKMLCLLAAVSLGSEAARGQGGPMPVDVAQPLTDTVVDYDIYTGRFEAVERVEIRARVSGYLDKVVFEEGDIVNEGDLLFVIDQRPFLNALRRAEASVAAAEADLELAEIEEQRAVQLAERNVGTEQDVDRTRAELSRADAQLGIAEADLASAKLDLDFTEIRAPFTGRISDTEIDPGNLVLGGSMDSSLLATLLRTDPIFFLATASEADYLRYVRLAASGARQSARDGQTEVAIRLMDEDDFVHQGVIEFVANELDPNSGTITARAEVPNPERYLLPGVFGRMRVPGSPEYEAVLIPDEAVLSDQDRKIVMTVDAEGMVSPRPVELGALHRGLRVIKSGISPDDTVVVNGVQRARPGQKVAAETVTLTFQGS
ncbi:MAG: efflux RND transporter periplasmic adaptor subunit [Pseudomonadota bacterium]